MSSERSSQEQENTAVKILYPSEFATILGVVGDGGPGDAPITEPDMTLTNIPAATLMKGGVLGVNKRITTFLHRENVICTLPIEATREGREKLVESLFEDVKVSSLYLLSEPVAASYATGHPMAIVLNVGFKCTSCSFVVNGETVKHCSSSALGLSKMGCKSVPDPQVLKAQPSSSTSEGGVLPAGVSKLWGGKEGSSVADLVSRMPEESEDCPVIVCGSGGDIAGLAKKISPLVDDRDVIVARPLAALTPYVGACILAPEMFNGLAITAAAYAEHGAGVAHWRCPV